MKKNSRRILVTAVIVLAIGMFCGLMFAVIFGSFIPQVVQIAGPFVCSGGNLVVGNETHSYSYGITSGGGISSTSRCTTAAGETDVTDQAVFVSGFLYGLVVFILIMAYLFIPRKD